MADEITVDGITYNVGVDLAATGGDRSELPSFEARKLPKPALPPRAVRANAWDCGEVYPINPKGPGLIGHGCGLPLGGDGGAAGFGLDWFGRMPACENDAEL